MNEFRPEAYFVNYGCAVNWRRPKNASQMARLFRHECELPPEIGIDEDILYRLKRKDIGDWAYGKEFNRNLFYALNKHHQGKRYADIGPGDNSPYLTFLSLFSKDITAYDIREPRKIGKGLKFRKVDLSDGKKRKPEFDLVTCISVLEHCGLGRYGDELDADGDIKLAEGIREVLKTGGIFIFAVPVGKAEIVGNLHRIYNDYRLAKILQGFEKVGEIGARMKGRDVKQPVIVGRKK